MKIFYRICYLIILLSIIASIYGSGQSYVDEQGILREPFYLIAGGSLLAMFTSLGVIAIKIAHKFCNHQPRLTCQKSRLTKED